MYNKKTPASLQAGVFFTVPPTNSEDYVLFLENKTYTYSSDDVCIDT
jgi:hypothetical protein